MVLPVLKYGDPRLRRKGERVGEITEEIRKLVADMFDTMYAARGVGLAAQQVGVLLQLTVLDVRGVKDRPSQLWLNSEPAEVDAFMPLVLINPSIKPLGSPILAPEGCLSFPEIYSDIQRPSEVQVTGSSLEGSVLEFRAGGLLARAIQHEFDHLQGILFIDRMDIESLATLKPELDELQMETRKAIARRNEG